MEGVLKAGAAGLGAAGPGWLLGRSNKLLQVEGASLNRLSREESHSGAALRPIPLLTASSLPNKCALLCVCHRWLPATASSSTWTPCCSSCVGPSWRAALFSGTRRTGSTWCWGTGWTSRRCVGTCSTACVLGGSGGAFFLERSQGGPQQGVARVGACPACVLAGQGQRGAGGQGQRGAGESVGRRCQHGAAQR